MLLVGEDPEFEGADGRDLVLDFLDLLRARLGEDDFEAVAADLADRHVADALGIDALLERGDQLVELEVVRLGPALGLVDQDRAAREVDPLLEAVIGDAPRGRGRWRRRSARSLPGDTRTWTIPSLANSDLQIRRDKAACGSSTTSRFRAVSGSGLVFVLLLVARRGRSRPGRWTPLLNSIFTPGSSETRSTILVPLGGDRDDRPKDARPGSARGRSS